MMAKWNSFWRRCRAVPCAVWRFYRDGFRSMTVGRYLWAIIIIKVAILLLVFKLWLLPDRLSRDYDDDASRAQAVREALSGGRR